MQYSHNEIHCEQFANTPHSPTKHTTNNPQIHHIHQRNTQRTIRKYTTPTNEIHNKQSANTPHSPTKYATNNPSGVGDRFIVPVFLFYYTNTFLFPRPHFRSTIFVYINHRTRIFVPHCGYNFQYSNILFEFKKNDLTTLTYFYKTFKIY